LKKADSYGCDVIILARGGGSVDDLWCFNDEKIAEAIYNCKTPVITGIGHEIDVTIADLVADERAATPTAAAQRATPDREEVIKKITTWISDSEKQLTLKLQNYMQSSDYCHTILDSYADRGLQYHRNIQSYIHIAGLSLNQNIDLNKERYSNLVELIDRNSRMFYQQNVYRFKRTIDILENVNPLKTLNRGYTLTKQDSTVIKSLKDVDLDREMTITYHDGDLKVRPLEKEEAK
ncbi:MAG: exodeoxyribonuclease VII large subunit, partial [Erysipelotrichaceae bacterium]|nr:exodeoxyribonuclease VII large subunit [Erysipelotrichaceae bacterium]